MATSTFVTADQLLRMPDDGFRYELIAGELRRMTPAGWKHGRVGGRILARLLQHLEQHNVGEVFLAETGFLLAREPDTVRAPDIALIRKERLQGKQPEAAFWPGAPDLAVEVVSPDDSPREIDDKAKAWLAAGSLAVWVVDPVARTVAVYRSATDVQVLTEGDELTGGDVLPGFRCQLRGLFIPQ
jgi:Uma2 family endonuclease